MKTNSAVQVFSSADPAPLAALRPAVTLGVFDGVHLGHRAIITEVTARARAAGRPALAVTFSNHPRTALGRSAPPGICSLEARLELLSAAGLDAVWVLPFTPELSLLAGAAFAEEYFFRRLRASAVVLGENAVFGRGRDGSARALAGWAADWDMAVTAVPALEVDGRTASSTAVRLAVREGRLAEAEGLLGRKFSVTGTVVHGQGRGRELGFPTLNLDPHHELRPPPGVYLTWTRLAGDGAAAPARPSITNIGRRPTDREIDAGLRDFLIETHLLSYNGDLYGAVAEVAFLHKTRDAARFSSVADLQRQVASDLAGAREWFAGRGTNSGE